MHIWEMVLFSLNTKIEFLISLPFQLTLRQTGKKTKIEGNFAKYLFVCLPEYFSIAKFGKCNKVR